VTNGWRIGQTAKHLNIERSYLWKMMQKYGIKKE